MRVPRSRVPALGSFVARRGAYSQLRDGAIREESHGLAGRGRRLTRTGPGCPDASSKAASAQGNAGDADSMERMQGRA